MHGHKTYGYGRWATILKNGEHFMGCSGLAYLFEFEEIVVVYRFLPEFWKRGLATEATRAILAYAFEELKLKRIVAIALTENRASIRVMEKTGMKFDILKRLPLNRFHQ
ncbi:Acetyltransferase (GNAT) domain-containing protein [Muriicola jejuensis]|nr:Acetyltransferase (GNAT) domain-containing protein [Muriicola jejuensis]